MTISVIIPVYKVEKYIRRCLQSVIDQERGEYHIECLIVDDCSPDNSMDIVNDIVNNYRGTTITFKIIRHEVNKGLSEARNSGIKASTGDYLFFIDSDDDILENTFKCYVTYLLEYPFVDLIMGNALDIEASGLSNTSETNNNSYCLINDKRTIIYKMLSRSIDRHAWNKLIRRSLFVDNNLFFDKGLLYEDVTWTYRLFSVISSVLLVPELTYMYEYNSASIIHTHSERSEKMLWSFVFILDYIINNPPVIDDKKVFFTEHCLFLHHWMLITIDLYEKYGADTQTREKLNALKRQLFWRSVRHFRIFLALFFLTMFKPLSGLMKIKAYRDKLYSISRIVYKLS